MGTIILFIVVLSLLVFVHELGHFLTAKKMGMDVEEFGFGFPPRAIGWKRGKTIYSINWLPLGGFVRIKGESGEHRNESDSFSAKPAWQRLLVLVAGVTMNFVLAIVLFSAGYMMGLPSLIDNTIPAAATIEDARLQIAQVVDGSPAATAQIVAGDELVSIDGKIFDTSEDARAYIGEHGNLGIQLTLQNEAGDFYEAEVASQDLEGLDVHGIGVGIVKTGIVTLPIHLAVVQGVVTTWEFTVEILRAFGGIIKNLIVHQQVGVDLSGPVGIAVITGEVAALGFVHLMQFAAILSINLAIINILPFPALDGGRVLFLAIEKMRGKPVNQRIEGLVHNLGFALLMMLVILVTYRDIVKFSDVLFAAFR